MVLIANWGEQKTLLHPRITVCQSFMSELIETFLRFTGRWTNLLYDSCWIPNNNRIILNVLRDDTPRSDNTSLSDRHSG
jgi:hypothetical protein